MMRTDKKLIQKLYFILPLNTSLIKKKVLITKIFATNKTNNEVV